MDKENTAQEIEWLERDWWKRSALRDAENRQRLRMIVIPPKCPNYRQRLHEFRDTIRHEHVCAVHGSCFICILDIQRTAEVVQTSMWLSRRAVIISRTNFERYSLPILFVMEIARSKTPWLCCISK